MGQRKVANWTAPREISPKEFVGRRAFGSKVFEKEGNSVLRYKINVFLDERIGTGLSVDRLGVRVAEVEVLTFLRPLCDAMAEKGSTNFSGWAQISAKDVENIIKVIEAIGEENPYHAEIDRSNYQNVDALRAFAFQLCVYASKHEFIPRPEIG